MSRMDAIIAPQASVTPAPRPEPAAAPEAPARPAFVPMAWHRALGYFAASAILALTQGLGQGFITANLPQIGGDLGATTNQSLWLMAAYMAPRASLPLLLIKIRTQYGLRRFAEVGIVVYVLVAALSFLVTDLSSAVAVQFVSGCASAPLSTLAFLYMLEPLPPERKINVGLAGALTFIMLGSPLARVLSPALLGDGGWTPIHIFGLGMALISLACVFLLPLAHQPRARVIAALDLISYGLIALCFGGLTVAFLMGAQLHWLQTPWLGVTLAVALACGAAAVAIELNRAAPLLDIRWLTSPAMLHLTGVLLLFRIILSEQTAGAPGLFRTLGMGPVQLVPLFWIVVAGSLLGGLIAGLLLKPGREPYFHMAALLLVAVGAGMDSQSTTLTRPAQMFLSQGMIALAGGLFLAPAMLTGMMRALAKGPTYILSFIIVFLSTQSIGGVLGSGLFGTFITQRQALHMHVLGEELVRTDAEVTATIGAVTRQLMPQVGDAAQSTAQAVTGIVSTVATQATVMAYNDAFLLLSIIAGSALVLLISHLLVLRWISWRRPAPVAA